MIFFKIEIQKFSFTTSQKLILFYDDGGNFFLSECIVFLKVAKS